MRAELVERFWGKIEKSEGCWLWRAGKTPDGYGQFWVDGKMMKVHRVAYELAFGEIPENRVIDHMCRNRACVNPTHLRVVTSGENQQNRAVLPTNSSGYRNVSWHGASRGWRVKLQLRGKTIHIGYYADLTDAAQAAYEARKRYFVASDPVVPNHDVAWEDA
jgi:hypothetical protein